MVEQDVYSALQQIIQSSPRHTQQPLFLSVLRSWSGLDVEPALDFLTFGLRLADSGNDKALAEQCWQLIESVLGDEALPEDLIELRTMQLLRNHSIEAATDWVLHAHGRSWLSDARCADLLMHLVPAVCRSSRAELAASSVAAEARELGVEVPEGAPAATEAAQSQQLCNGLSTCIQGLIGALRDDLNQSQRGPTRGHQQGSSAGVGSGDGLAEARLEKLNQAFSQLEGVRQQPISYGNSHSSSLS